MFGEYFRVFEYRFEHRASTSTQKMTISNFEQARTHTFPSGNERASSGSKFGTTLLEILGIFGEYGGMGGDRGQSIITEINIHQVAQCTN